MNTSSLKSLLVKLTLMLGLAVGILPGVVAASDAAVAKQAPANSPQQKILANALTPEVRQTLQDAINSSGSDRLTAR